MSNEQHYTITETIGDQATREHIVMVMASEGYTVLSSARYTIERYPFWFVIAQHTENSELREAIFSSNGFNVYPLFPTYRLAVSH